MSQSIFEELVAARREGKSCVLATIAATRGSVPRQAGSKMIVYPDGTISGTIGGGKFESLLAADCLAALDTGTAVLKDYVLREGHPDSFGAICGGEVTVLIEPQGTAEAIYLVGAGHCAKAIAQAARTCGLRITVIEDRADFVEDFEPADCKIADVPAVEFISERNWKPADAIVLVNRSYQLDRDALKAALGKTGFGYLGMMGSSRKVLRVYDELKQCGVDPSAFERVHAPIGLDIGADSPEEIAISILAEILAALRHRSGRPFQLTKTEPNPVQMSTSSLPLTELNRMDRSSFVGRVGWVYEHSPWVAEKAWEHRPFADLDALHSAMDAIVQAAPEEKRLALIQAHPDLAGRQAKLGQLTDASSREQAEAGLKGLAADLTAELDRQNRAYREKFGFPFIICARLENLNTILAALANRLEHDQETEITLALREISKIARLRLMDAIS